MDSGLFHEGQICRPCGAPGRDGTFFPGLAPQADQPSPLQGESRAHPYGAPTERPAVSKGGHLASGPRPQSAPGRRGPRARPGLVRPQSSLAPWLVVHFHGNLKRFDGSPKHPDGASRFLHVTPKCSGGPSTFPVEALKEAGGPWNESKAPSSLFKGSPKYLLTAWNRFNGPSGKLRVSRRIFDGPWRILQGALNLSGGPLK